MKRPDSKTISLIAFAVVGVCLFLNFFNFTRPNLPPPGLPTVNDYPTAALPADLQQRVDETDAKGLELYRGIVARADTDIASQTAELKDETDARRREYLEKMIDISVREKANAEKAIKLLETPASR